jgi:hypothetical protein
MPRLEPHLIAQETNDLPLTRAGRLYLLLIGVLGFSTLFFAVADWESPDLFKYAGYLTIAVLSSGLRISVPGVTGTLSLNFLFVLLASSN